MTKGNRDNGMPICVIFNPQAGKRRARRRLARFLDVWRSRVDLWPTEYSGHGVELGRRAAESNYSIVAAAGGDGTAHDVANGILAVERRNFTFAVIPIGSANDYAFSVRAEFGASVLDDASGALVDVGFARLADGRHQYFLECLGLGLNGMVTLESRKIQRLQGPLLYGLAAWRAMRSDPVSQLRVRWDDGPMIESASMLMSVLVGRREGAFQLAPQAKLGDGKFNYVHALGMGRLEVMSWLPRLFLWGPPAEHPKVQQGNCRKVFIESERPLTIHTDGEMFCTPDDAVRRVHIELLSERLRVKVCPPD